MKNFIPYSAEERTITLPPGVDFRRPGTVDPMRRRDLLNEQMINHEAGLMGLAGLAAAQNSPFGSHGPLGHPQMSHNQLRAAGSWLADQLTNPRYL